MINNYNILVTSISKKIPFLKAVRHSLVKLNLKSKLYGGDSNPDCIGSYFVDEFWLMPQLNTLKIKDFISYCKSHNIKMIIPTRDGELSFFAKHKKTLYKDGIHCMVSELKCIENCLDKLLFYQTLAAHHLPTILTTENADFISSNSLVVKERFGAGSRSLGLNLSPKNAKEWAKKLQSPIFQPLVSGKEYSVDVYIDSHHAPHGVIVRHRDLVEDGESQITSSIKNKKMESLCLKIAALLEIKGHAVFQLLSDTEGGLHVIECNPRFGGASTLSVAMGLHSFEWFILESLKKPLPPFIRSKKELRQVRFPEDKVFIQ